MASTRRTTRALLVILFALAAAPPALAAPPSGPHAWCGTDPATFEVVAARHAAFERQRERERLEGRLPLKSTPLVYQVGNVAVIEDDGTIVRGNNPFDLQGKSMQFLRRPKGVSAVRSRLGYKQLIGDKLALGDDDAVEVVFPEGFRYPFGNRVYDSVWVNSDGNLTLGGPESASSARSLQRFLNGPPRIAALFTDLDPSAATGAAGVYVSFPPHRVRITWLEVPLFGASNRLNTFQLTLFETGRVNVAYGDRVDATDAIVGVQPFGLIGLELIDYDLELPFRPQRVAIVEEFQNGVQRDDLAIASTFYEHFEDVYDHLVVWLDFPAVLSGAFAFEINISNTVTGIGLGNFDFSRQLGSGGQLQSFVQMGTLSRYPDDPDAAFFRNVESTMSVLGHEVGHRWLAFVRFIDQTGSRSDLLLGRDLAHWSFHMDSQGSVMEGNDLVDNGDGTFTATGRAASRYGELDQYLMGLIPPAAVPGFFHLANATGGRRADPPTANLTFSGDRVDVTVEDVIAAEGERLPRVARAPKSFRTAFVLVGRDGEPVSQESIDHVERIRVRWHDWFQEATDFRATVKTGLFPK